MVAVDAKSHKLAGERERESERLLAHILVAEKVGLASGLAESRSLHGVQILSPISPLSCFCVVSSS